LSVQLTRKENPGYQEGLDRTRLQAGGLKTRGLSIVIQEDCDVDELGV